ncbi:anthranilate phosphoribosyltransferase [Desulfallas sp. Bu1-1]|uniref:anthranilate phosphoribosyltransferase n=1 Tax=Desulfallas sp. Bu1-1 TaxID=2787620 RepID=UPI00189F224A|nr:anthranilate phosphoribosyltransferase [Desulfallas sp. Bu1-1]MBF7081840.1 anthranilate phosphoribosyltransferase [Desulfallas sp. Bu1-1]
MIKELLKKVVAGENLTEAEAAAAMEEIMDGGATPAQIAGLLTALKLKGETIDEITGFARVMRSKATPVRSCHPLLVDTCGTGGDGANTFNISTAAALVLAGAGVKVAKHGNRSVSSRCGSADVLEALGVNLDLEPGEMAACLEEVGIAFLYAPALHGAMKHAAGPRRELGFRTVFNILGPLTNPAGARAQVLGVYSAQLVPVLAEVLLRLGAQRAFVVHGAGGLDEVSPAGPALVCEVKDGNIFEYTLDPGEFGFARAGTDQLAGGSPEENAEIILSILKGEAGPRRDAVVLNAALGLMAAGAAEDFTSGIDLAARSLDRGLAQAKLQEMIRFTARYRKAKVAGL